MNMILQSRRKNKLRPLMAYRLHPVGNPKRKV
jgi:hypothetical protein